MQRARAPFLGVTFMATACVAGWQSNRMYKVRQQALLEEFAATMMYHLGDEREMASAVKEFRGKLGPGNFKGPMFVSFVKALAVETQVGVTPIRELKRVVAQMQLTQSAVAQLLGEAFDALKKQPSVLGKLVFVAERSVPAAAQSAQLRTKFPTWSEETVSTLQRAMLENLYRDMVEAPGYADDAETLAILGLTSAEATRLKEEVEEKKLAAAEAEQAEVDERRRADQLQAAIERASELGSMPTRATATATEEEEDDDDDAPAGDAAPADGTHEYECTKCGYTMYPAAGREFKFYGADFKCPTCGTGKEDFVDNGLVDVDDDDE